MPKLIEALTRSAPRVTRKKYLDPFLASRLARNCSGRTLGTYRYVLEGFLAQCSPDNAKGRDVERNLLSIPGNGRSYSTRHIHHWVIRTFFNWREAEYGLDSPMKSVQPLRLAKLVLPSLTREQFLYLMEEADGEMGRSVIALLAESGLRVSELAAIKLEDIGWSHRTIRVFGKGGKEAYAPFGELSERHLRAWLAVHSPNSSVWGISKRGIQTMLRRLEERTGLPCNPHTFRRTFACLLRKAGVDTMTIKDLGRWESLEMVQRYTRSVTFEDSLRWYRAPLGAG